jgi:NAD(P)H-dependent FMN reductase
MGFREANSSSPVSSIFRFESARRDADLGWILLLSLKLSVDPPSLKLMEDRQTRPFFHPALKQVATLSFHVMPHFQAISGSPSSLSRNNFLFHGIEQRLAPYEIALRNAHAIELQPFRPGASDRLADLIKTVRDALAILLITPVPSEDWSGCLKTLLQFLPAGALQYRPLLLIGTGGTVDELPNLERSLEPELTRLRGRLALSSIHIGPKNWVFSTNRPPWLTAGTELRINRALDQLHRLTQEAVPVS